MNRIEQLAGCLLPYRLLLLVGALLSMLTASASPLIAEWWPWSSDPNVVLIAMIPTFGGTSCWGLLCLAHWYAPKQGPLNLERLRHRQDIMVLFDWPMRYIAPVLLLIWFVCPGVVAVIIWLQK